MVAVNRITVEVKASANYQSVGYSAEVTIPEGLDPVEAVAHVQEIRALIAEQALSDVKALSPVGTGMSITPPSQSTVPAGSGHGEWAIGQKPNNKGSFRYLPSSVFPSALLREQATAQLASLGIDADDVDVFDDRVGNYGLESGNTSYQVGKIKAKDGSRIAQAMQGKAIVAGIDFDNDGSVKVVLTKDGKAALQALTIAANLGASF